MLSLAFAGPVPTGTGKIALSLILRGQTLLAVLEILSGQAAILRDMVSLEKRTR